MEKVFVVLYDGKRDCEEQVGACCFWVDKGDLEPFVEVCKENRKYVVIELDYAGETDNG